MPDRVDTPTAALQRAIDLQEAIDTHTTALTKLSRQRRDAIREVLDNSDMNQTELADLLGLTRSRVSHILNS